MLDTAECKAAVNDWRTRCLAAEGRVTALDTEHRLLLRAEAFARDVLLWDGGNHSAGYNATTAYNARHGLYETLIELDRLRESPAPSTPGARDDAKAAAVNHCASCHGRGCQSDGVTHCYECNGTGEVNAE
jgi:hypothetical protein